MKTLHPDRLSALEISGKVWASFGFGEYVSVAYPDFDLCRQRLDRTFDLIIAEHVFEHLARPELAIRNAFEMLKPGGHFLMVTPFLYKVHPCPIDCYRWTETRLSEFLSTAGFAESNAIQTGSWGNRACIQATFQREYILFNRYLHSIRNEPEYPVAVWALACKPAPLSN